jgi:hypothetical protein
MRHARKTTLAGVKGLSIDGGGIPMVFDRLADTIVCALLAA